MSIKNSRIIDLHDRVQDIQEIIRLYTTLDDFSNDLPKLADSGATARFRSHLLAIAKISEEMMEQLRDGET